jgi:hypothetical protein
LGKNKLPLVVTITIGPAVEESTAMIVIVGSIKNERTEKDTLHLARKFVVTLQ